MSILAAFGAKKKNNKLGKPRRRAGPLWRNTWVRVGMIAVMAGLAGGGGWWAHSTGYAAKAVENLRWNAIALTAKAGFRVDEILVVGRKETSQKTLRETVRLARGAPILAFDIEDARDRVERLPWVRRATVERMLPDTILLTVEERQAVALWQHKGKFALVDERGEVILRKGLERFSNLLVVVGEGAPEHAADLLETLATQPELMSLVKSAVRVGDRRWNLQLTGGIDVRLPEVDPGAAWARLAEYEKSHKVLDRDVQVLDLRLPDRLIVRKTPRSRSSQAAGNRET